MFIEGIKKKNVANASGQRHFTHTHTMTSPALATDTPLMFISSLGRSSTTCVWSTSDTMTSPDTCLSPRQASATPSRVARAPSTAMPTLCLVASIPGLPSPTTWHTHTHTAWQHHRPDTWHQYHTVTTPLCDQLLCLYTLVLCIKYWTDTRNMMKHESIIKNDPAALYSWYPYTGSCSQQCIKVSLSQLTHCKHCITHARVHTHIHTQREGERERTRRNSHEVKQLKSFNIRKKQIVKELCQVQLSSDFTADRHIPVMTSLTKCQSKACNLWPF